MTAQLQVPPADLDATITAHRLPDTRRLPRALRNEDLENPSPGRLVGVLGVLVAVHHKELEARFTFDDLFAAISVYGLVEPGPEGRVLTQAGRGVLAEYGWL